MHSHCSGSLAGLAGKIVRGGLLLGWLACYPVMAGVSTNPDLPPETAATVNGQAIPKRLVETFLKNDHDALGLNPKTDAERQQLADLPAAILDELVDRTLIAQAVRERSIEPTAAELDADERRMIMFCGNEARYAAYTAQSGFTRAEYRENVLRTTANGRAMIAALTRDLIISDDEIKAYYEAHHADADFQQPERVAGSHILINAQAGVLSGQLETKESLVPDSPEMNAAVAKETARRREIAEKVRTEAAAPGADFAALATKYSEDIGTRGGGGSLGTFAHGVHPETLDDAFFALKPGEIGPVVKTDFGFHVIRVESHLPAGQQSLADSTPEIRRRLLRAKSAEQLRAWLAQTRAGAKIIVRDAQDLPAARQ